MAAVLSGQGMAAAILAAAADAVAEAVRNAIPGAVLGVVTRGGDRAACAAGLAQVEPDAVPMRRETWFDLASLTKVLFTTPAILALVAQGRIGLDDGLAAAIPDLRQYDVGAPERRLTLRQCLSHQTHLPAVEPLYTYGQDPATLRAFVLQRVWRAGAPVYSDINFILLGIVIERLTGVGLSGQALGRGLSFRPEPEESAATERCSWRGRVLRGEVHDENAFALGGGGRACRAVRDGRWGAGCGGGDAGGAGTGCCGDAPEAVGDADAGVGGAA